MCIQELSGYMVTAVTVTVSGQSVNGRYLFGGFKIFYYLCT
jgi:hypothetical protein